MPELAEVETWRQLAHRTAVGQRIEAVTTWEDEIIYDRNTTAEVVEGLTGATLTGTERQGKHFWFLFDRPGHLYVHFGMSGSLWALTAEEERPSHAKIELQLENGDRLVYRNMRRIGRLRWLQDVRAVEPVLSLGPDPFDPAFTKAFVAEKLAKRKSHIKATLLNQSIFAGVGNWIADEVLYQAGISPFRRCNELSEKDVQNLYRILLRILKKAVEVEADDSRFPKNWLFHYRWGKKAEKTAKGETIQFDTIGGRTAAWVPAKQV